MAATSDLLLERLRRLEAREAIRDAIHSYAMAGDRGNDASMVRKLFTANGVFEAKGMGRFEGLDNIVAGLAAIARDTVVWAFHAASGPLIRLSEDGLRARVFWWIWVPASLKGPDGAVAPHWGAGQYNATMVESQGQWKFEQVLLETRLLTPFEGPWTPVDGPFQWLT